MRHLAVILALLAASPAAAQDFSGITCAAWISETLQGDTAKRAAIEQWLRGFLDGVRVGTATRPLSPVA
jgi:hypothetical protein